MINSVSFSLTHSVLNKLLGDSAIYKSSIKEKIKYNLVLGSFESYQGAKKRLAQLSDSASQHCPWIRKFSSINKEIE